MKMSTKTARDLYRNRYIFRRIAKSNKINRDAILTKSPLTLFQTIKLLCNCLKDGRFKINNTHRTRLETHKGLIRDLADGNNKAIKSKVIMNGNGVSSFFKTVLPIITPLLLGLL